MKSENIHDNFEQVEMSKSTDWLVENDSENEFYEETNELDVFLENN